MGALYGLLTDIEPRQWLHYSREVWFVEVEGIEAGFMWSGGDV